MHRLKMVGLGLAFATFAFMSSASAVHMKDQAFVVGPNGEMKEIKMDKSKMDAMIKEAMPVGDGMAVFILGGRFYLMMNHKMANGQMTFEAFGIPGFTR
jgi:hypothetical protein